MILFNDVVKLSVESYHCDGSNKDKDRCYLSQLRFLYYVYGRVICNMCWYKGTIFRYVYIKITMKSYWIMSGLYISEILFLQLIGLYWSVIRVYIDVICIVDFVEGERIFSPPAVGWFELL